MTFESKYTSLLCRIKEAGLSAKTIDETMTLGEIYGKILYANHADIYRDDAFEVALITQYMNEKKFAIESKLPRKEELHVISEPYSSGGHTRLLENLLKIRGHGDVLVTRALSEIGNRLRLDAGTHVFHSIQGFSVDEIVEVAAEYKTIFLHIHPDDLISSVAIGIVRKLFNSKVIFINHADHIFSFGFQCSDIIAEISEYGFYLSSQKRQVHSGFLGIPVEMTSISQCHRQIQEGKFQIFSAGEMRKFKPQLGLSFPKLADKILGCIPSASITVIGPNLLTNWWWWTAKIRNPRRLRVHNILPYVQYIAALEVADIYIDSYPMTGGTALPEVRAKGIPVTGILQGSNGYTPFDATKFSDFPTLLHALKQYQNNTGDILNKNNSQKTINCARKFHDLHEIALRLDNMISSDEYISPPGGGREFDINFYRNQWISTGKIIIPQEVINKIIQSNLTSKCNIIKVIFRFSSFSDLPIRLYQVAKSLFTNYVIKHFAIHEVIVQKG